MTQALVVAIVLAVSAVSAAAVDIQHDGVGCVVADKFPRLEARLSPSDAVARARVHFRPENGKHWYSVALTPEGAVYAAALPKPRKSLASLVYYIEVTDTAMVASRTAEFTPTVGAGAAACQDEKVASTLASAAITLEVPAGAPAIPAGFSGTGITAGAVAGAAAGAAAGAGVAAAVGGGGAATALLVGGGVLAAAGATAAVAVSGGGDDDTDSGPPPPPPVRQFEMFFDPFLDVSVCVNTSRTFSGAVFAVDDAGNFDANLSQESPNTLRAVGRVTDTTFQGTFACFSNNNASMNLGASGSGGNFSGSFSFAGRSGTWRGNFKPTPSQ